MMKEKSREKREHKSLNLDELYTENDTHIIDHRGQTLMTTAIIERRVKTVIELVQTGGAVNKPDEHGVPNGGAVNRPDEHGFSPLAWCVYTRQSKMLSYLQEKGAEFSGRNDISLINEALSDYDINMLTIALKTGCNVNHLDKKGRIPLTDAIRSNNIEKVGLLVKHRADPNVVDGFGRYPLTEAFKTVTWFPTISIEIIDLLLKYKADVNISDGHDCLPLIQAVHAKNLSFVTKIVSSGADVNLSNRGRYPLIESIISGNIDIFNSLITAGANVNQEDVNGRLPLSQAALSDEWKMFEILLQNGADCNKLNTKLKSPFIEALGIKKNGFRFAKRMILDGKVNMDEQFYLSCIYLPIRRFQYLIDWHANPFKLLSDNQRASTKVLYHELSRHVSLSLNDFISSEKWNIILRECGEVTMHEKDNIILKELFTCKSFKLAFAKHKLTIPRLLQDFRHPTSLQRFAHYIFNILVQLIKLGTERSSFDVSRKWTCAESDCSCALLRKELELDDILREKLTYHEILPMPCTLQMNCRNIIRKSLFTNCVTKVNKLPLPDTMKKFLIFEGEI